MAEDKDDTVYCDIQMPVEQGRDLLQLVKHCMTPAVTRALSGSLLIWSANSPTPSTSSKFHPVEDVGSTDPSAWSTSDHFLKS